METKKLWYAIINDNCDGWDTGSLDYSEAVKMANMLNYNSILVIDADYDENGNATSEPICINELHRGEDFDYNTRFLLINGNENNESIIVFEDKQEALKFAVNIWDRLSSTDKKTNHVIVATVNDSLNTLCDYAFEDGEIDFTCYHSLIEYLFENGKTL